MSRINHDPWESLSFMQHTFAVYIAPVLAELSTLLMPVLPLIEPRPWPPEFVLSNQGFSPSIPWTFGAG